MRALQIRVVKTKNEQPQAPYNQSCEKFENQAEVIGRQVQKLITKIGSAAIGYVVVDTVRKVLIARALRR